MTDARPFILALAGPGSNTGKTRVLARIIRRLATRHPVGALKVSTATPDHLCARTGRACDCLQFDGRMRLLVEPEYIERDRKDTGQFVAAGADPVWWLQTTADVQIESVTATIARFAGPPVWVIEGAGPIRAGLADLALLLARRDGRESKPGYDTLLPLADAVLASDREARLPLEQLELDLRGRGLPADRPVIDLAGDELPTTLIGLIEGRIAEHLAHRGRMTPEPDAVNRRRI